MWGWILTFWELVCVFKEHLLWVSHKNSCPVTFTACNYVELVI